MGAAPDGRPRVVVHLGRARYEQLFGPEEDARLRALATVGGPFDPAPGNDLRPEVAAADVLFLAGGTHVPRAVLEGAPRLRWIADTSGGPPRLDYAAAAARGITVTDCRRAFGPAVGEMALALYLALMRDVVAHDRALHTADGTEGVPKSANREASGRTIGLIGLGGIARSLLHFLAPFRPRLLVYDPHVPEAAVRAVGAERVDLPDLLERAEATFVMAVPTAENRRLLGRAELALIPPQGVLLLISRSWLVDEAALIERLQAGTLRAGIDVYDAEPLPAGHPYRSLPNVVLTPHRAGGTVESYRRIGRDLVEDLERFARGAPPAANAVVTAAGARLQGRQADG